MVSDIVERDEAIQVAIQALNDWAVTYASDMCDEATVEAARARVLKNGTLAYTADAAEGLRRLQAELSSLKASAKEARAEALEEAAKALEKRINKAGRGDLENSCYANGAALVRRLKEGA